MSAFTQPPKVLAIARMVANAYGIAAEELLGRSRRHEVVRARQVAMYLAVRLSGRTVVDVAGIFHRDQSTVRWAIAAVSAQVAFASRLQQLEAAARDLPDRASVAHVPAPKELPHGTETQVAAR